MQIKINRQTFLMSVTVFPDEMPGIREPQTRQKMLGPEERALVRLDNVRRPGEPCPFKLKLKLRMEGGKTHFGFRLVPRLHVDTPEAGTVSADDVSL